jgi:anti-sigma B factor antagonist
MNEFSIGLRTRESVSVIDLHGYLDAHTAPELEKTFQKHLDAGQYRIVVNFQELSYISSAGLGVLMQFIEDIREHEGDIKLANMSNRVYNVFDLLGFPMLYEIFQEENEAVNKFLNKSENPA